jgi:hypothetical protein
VRVTLLRSMELVIRPPHRNLNFVRTLLAPGRATRSEGSLDPRSELRFALHLPLAPSITGLLG